MEALLGRAGQTNLSPCRQRGGSKLIAVRGVWILRARRNPSGKIDAKATVGAKKGGSLVPHELTVPFARRSVVRSVGKLAGERCGAMEFLQKVEQEARGGDGAASNTATEAPNTAGLEVVEGVAATPRHTPSTIPKSRWF